MVANFESCLAAREAGLFVVIFLHLALKVGKYVAVLKFLSTRNLLRGIGFLSCRVLATLFFKVTGLAELVVFRVLQSTDRDSMSEPAIELLPTHLAAGS
ncbi:hypothetical protein HDK77DRAFT_161057 [Phyllosticta capitalensis]